MGWRVSPAWYLAALYGPALVAVAGAAAWYGPAALAYGLLAAALLAATRGRLGAPAAEPR